MLKRILGFALFTIPFLGLEMSPLSGSWVTSLIIWGIWVVIIVLYLMWVIKRRGLIKVEDKNTHIDESVTSYNQQGGITARNVSIQPSDRKLSINVGQQLKDHLDTTTFK
jgi:hypothetical protein